MDGEAAKSCLNADRGGAAAGGGSDDIVSKIDDGWCGTAEGEGNLECRAGVLRFPETVASVPIEIRVVGCICIRELLRADVSRYAGRIRLGSK